MATKSKHKKNKRQNRNHNNVQEIIEWMKNKQQRHLIFLSESRKRALEAEEKVRIALKKLRKMKIKFYGGWRIEKIKENKHFSAQDLEGKDFSVILMNKEKKEREIYIQVKDYWTWQEELNYRKKGIVLVGVWPNENKDKAIKRTYEALQNFLFRQELENENPLNPLKKEKKENKENREISKRKISFFHLLNFLNRNKNRN